MENWKWQVQPEPAEPRFGRRRTDPELPVAEAAQWEYLFVSCDEHRYALKPRYANGEELKNWKDRDVPTYSAWLGEQGWELVGFAYNWSALYPEERYHRLTFKRRKPATDMRWHALT